MYLPITLDMHILTNDPESYIILYSCVQIKGSFVRKSQRYEYAWVLVRDIDTANMAAIDHDTEKLLYDTNISGESGNQIIRTLGKKCMQRM